MFRYLLILIAAVFLVAACDDTADETESDVTLEQDKYAFDTTDLKTEELDESEVSSFKLRYGFEQGNEYNYRLTMISQNNQEIESNDTTMGMDVDQTIIYVINMNVESKDEEGVADIKVNISSANLDAIASGETYHYESGVTTDTSEIEKYAEYEALYNNPFFIRVNELGELIEVYRADGIASRFLKIRGLTDSVSTDEKNMLRNDLVQQVLKPIILQIIRVFPEKELAPDSTWTYTPGAVPLLTFQLNYTNKYEVENVEKFDDDKIVVIDAGLDTKIDGKTEHTDERGISYKFEKPISTAEGKIFFNLDRGVVQKSKTSTKVVMSYTMEAATPQGTQSGKKKEIITNRNILELL